MAIDSYWRERYVKQTQSVASRVKYTKAFYAKEAGRVHKYRGGMPVGFFAAIAQWESNGSMGSVGDQSLGEIGYYQVTDSFPERFGIDPRIRYQAEGNIFIAGLEYNAHANRLAKDFPNLIAPGTKDQWWMSRLVFAIGYGGTKVLINRAGRRYGHVWEDIKAYVDRTGGIPLGTQSAGKIWYRVSCIPIQWQVGSATGLPMYYANPVKVPAYRPYRVPNYYGKMLDWWSNDAIMLASMVASLWLID